MVIYHEFGMWWFVASPETQVLKFVEMFFFQSRQNWGLLLKGHHMLPRKS